MRILYVTPYVPSKIRVRPYNLIKQLSRRNEITLVSLVQDEIDRKSISEISDYCQNVFPVTMSKRQSVMSCAKRLLTRMPLQAAYTYLPSFINIVDNIVVRNQFDIVHVEHIRGAHYAAHVQSLPKVYDSVDCITLLLHQFLTSKRNPLAWFLTLEEWAKMRVYEAMMSSKFEKVIITSTTDKQALDKLIWQRIKLRLEDLIPVHLKLLAPEDQEDWRLTRQLIELAQDQRLESLRSDHLHVSVVPNGVDFDYFKRQEDVKEDSSTIVFSGKMSYYANAQAVHYFHDNVLPIVRAKRPDVKFKIVGANPPPSIVKLGREPGIEVTGYVEDMRPHIASAALSVCPIGVGVGIQNKLLEAMAMGKPVVATAKACSAINAKDGADLLMASTAEEFAQQILRLLKDANLRQWIGNNAVKYVTENHSWQTLSDRLEDVYREARAIYEEKRLALASLGG